MAKRKVTSPRRRQRATEPDPEPERLRKWAAELVSTPAVREALAKIGIHLGPALAPEATK